MVYLFKTSESRGGRIACAGVTEGGGMRGSDRAAHPKQTKSELSILDESFSDPKSRILFKTTKLVKCVRFPCFTAQ